MKIQSATDFVEAVVQLWPPFRWDEVQEKAWAEMMARELSGFKPAVLERGFQEMVRRRRETRIPTPAECIAACVEARKWLEMEASEGKLPEFRMPNDPWSRERRKLAYDLIKSGMGKQAAKDNPCWILQLWDFARNNQRLPISSQEIDALKREAQEFEEHYAMTLRPDFPSPMIQGMGANMLAKRKALCEEAMGNNKSWG